MQAAIAPFETVSDLKAAHEALLVKQDAMLGEAASEAAEAASIRELEAGINEFVARAVATGALIEALKDRTACQVLLDYWSSALARADLARPQTKLAPFDEARLPDLKKVLRERNVPAPYVGLDPFGLGDRERFFGRDADIRELVARVERLPLTIVTGASGSGKSSLVLAGLLPELQKEGWAISGEPRTPGNDALGHFAESLAGLVEPPVSAALRPKWAADQATAMRADAQHAAKLLQRSGAERSVLVIDQFEEIFTLASPGDREALAANLAAVLAPGAKLCRAVVTVREEFKDQINQLTVLEGMTKDAWYAMRPLTYGELRQAVEGPAGRVGLVFQEGIVDDLVKKVLGQPAALPLLQFTLKQLWQGVDRNRITQEVYKRVGDPLVALKLNADRTYAALPEQEKLVAKEILLQLVAVDTLGDFYRVPVRRKEIRATHASVVPEVLRKLEEADFIRTEHDEESPGESLVEIKHESLLRNWPLLVDWVREKREQHLRRSQFARIAEEWAAAGEPPAMLLTGFQIEEARQWPELSATERRFLEKSEDKVEAEKAVLRRKNRWLAVAATAAFTFALAASVFAALAWQGWVQAEKNAAQAKANAEEARAATARAEGQAAVAEEEESIATIQRDLAAQQRLIAEQNETRAEAKEQEAQKARAEADRLRQLAASRALAWSAKANVGVDPDLALRLAGHASRNGIASAEAMDALSEALSISPALAPPRIPEKGAKAARVLLNTDQTRLVTLEALDGRQYARGYSTATGERTASAPVPPELRAATLVTIDTGGNRVAVSDGTKLALLDLRLGRPIKVADSPIANPVSIAFSASQQWIVVVGEDAVAVDFGEASGSRVLLPAGARTALGLAEDARIAVTADLEYIALADSKGRVVVVSGADGKTIVKDARLELKEIKDRTEYASIEVIGSRTLLHEYDGQVTLFDLPSLAERQRFAATQTDIKIVPSPDGTRYLTSYQGLATVTDTRRQVSVKLPRTVGESVHRSESPAVFSVDGETLVGVDQAGLPRVAAITGYGIRGTVATIPPADKTVSSPAGNAIAVRAANDADGAMWDVWDITAGKRVFRVRADAAEFSLDGDVLFTSRPARADDMVVRESWSVRDGTQIWSVEVPVRAAATWGQGGDLLGIHRAEGCAVLRRGSPVTPISVPGPCTVSGVSSLPPRAVLVVRAPEAKWSHYEVWDIDTRARMWAEDPGVFQNRESSLTANRSVLAISRLQEGSWTTDLVDVAQGRLVRRVPGRREALPRSGDRLIVSTPPSSPGENATFTVYRVSDGVALSSALDVGRQNLSANGGWSFVQKAEKGTSQVLIWRLDGRRSALDPWRVEGQNARFSPTDRFLVVDANDAPGQRQIWDTATRTKAAVQPAAGEQVVFSPRDDLIALIDSAQTRLLAADGTEQFAFRAPSYAGFEGARFSRDGKRIVLETSDGTRVVNSLDRAELTGPLLKERLGRVRQMTDRECMKYLETPRCPP